MAKKIIEILRNKKMWRKSGLSELVVKVVEAVELEAGVVILNKEVSSKEEAANFWNEISQKYPLPELDIWGSGLGIFPNKFKKLLKIANGDEDLAVSIFKEFIKNPIRVEDEDGDPDWDKSFKIFLNDFDMKSFLLKREFYGKYKSRRVDRRLISIYSSAEEIKNYTPLQILIRNLNRDEITEKWRKKFRFVPRKDYIFWGGPENFNKIYASLDVENDIQEANAYLLIKILGKNPNAELIGEINESESFKFSAFGIINNSRIKKINLKEEDIDFLFEIGRRKMFELLTLFSIYGVKEIKNIITAAIDRDLNINPYDIAAAIEYFGYKYTILAIKHGARFSDLRYLATVKKLDKEKEEIKRKIFNFRYKNNKYEFYFSGASHETLLSGYLTDCCMVVHGAGESCIINAYGKVKSDMFLIKDSDGNVRFAIWVFISKDKKTIVFDSIEHYSGYRVDEEIVEGIAEALKWAKAKYENVIISWNYEKVPDDFKELLEEKGLKLIYTDHLGFVKEPKWVNYSDYDDESSETYIVELQ